MNKPLEDLQNTIALVSLNENLAKLQQKGWSHFFKNKENRWRSEIWEPVYCYTFISIYKKLEKNPSVIIKPIPKKIVKNLCNYLKNILIVL